MVQSDDEFRADLYAHEVLSKLNVTSLPVNPLAIADSRDIIHQEYPSYNAGISGCLMKNADQFGILYSTRFTNEGLKRFNIAHELGHYFMPGHIDALFQNGQGMHQSETGFTSDDRYEREADAFAAALLMPKNMFKEACKQSGEGLTAIETLADLCQTSLMATAIRYVKFCDDPIAIICSIGNRIQFGFLSPSMKEFREITWPRKGSALPSGSGTFRFNQDNENIEKTRRLVTMSSLDTWFGGDHAIDVHEEVIGLGGYGRTLTVLRAEEVPSCDEEEDENRMPSQRWRER